MKILAAAVVLALWPLAVHAADPLEDELVALEKASWAAWQARDGHFFEGFLSDDHLEIHAFGVSNKASVVASVASPACSVESYAVSGFAFRRLSEDAATLTYRAEQKTTCNGSAVPSPVWATSVFARRGGRWVNVLYQHTALSAK
ncbi:MAG TPA: nuclear transport factor 2 family protein [Usitatibacter sp.]|jgi:hypothetical protein|nr:nuclear transport factor 2 family protein [Usitatibacter sp.]